MTIKRTLMQAYQLRNPPSWFETLYLPPIRTIFFLLFLASCKARLWNYVVCIWVGWWVRRKISKIFSTAFIVWHRIISTKNILLKHFLLPDFEFSTLIFSDSDFFDSEFFDFDFFQLLFLDFRISGQIWWGTELIRNKMLVFTIFLTFRKITHSSRWRDL